MIVIIVIMVNGSDGDSNDGTNDDDSNSNGDNNNNSIINFQPCKLMHISTLTNSMPSSTAITKNIFGAMIRKSIFPFLGRFFIHLCDFFHLMRRPAPLTVIF